MSVHVFNLASQPVHECIRYRHGRESLPLEPMAPHDAVDKFAALDSQASCGVGADGFQSPATRMAGTDLCDLVI